MIKLRLLAQAPVALPRRSAVILCAGVGLGSLRRLRSRCRIFLQYTKYCCKAAPNQDAKFARKSLSINRASLPLATPQLRFCADFMHKSTHFTLLSKNKDI